MLISNLLQELSQLKGGEVLCEAAEETKEKTKSQKGRVKTYNTIAKGFTPGSSTPSSAWGSIKKHAARTELRHGKGSKELAARHGSRSMKKARGIGGKDGVLDKGK